MGRPDPLHAEVAQIALSAVHQYGYALGGGLALVVHGVVDRPTEDVDVFSDASEGMTAAAQLVEAALQDAGFEVTRVDGPSELSAVIDDLDQYMVEWELSRSDQIVMDLGPVMDLDDLVSWKAAALVGRARERDYVDIAALLGRYTPDELLDMARQVDPGMEADDVPMVGRRLDRLPDEAFYPYRLDREDVAELRRRFTSWPR